MGDAMSDTIAALIVVVSVVVVACGVALVREFARTMFGMFDDR